MRPFSNTHEKCGLTLDRLGFIPDAGKRRTAGEMWFARDPTHSNDICSLAYGAVYVPSA